MAQLPAYYVRNQLLDLAPINSALDGYQEQQNKNVQYQDQRQEKLKKSFGNLALLTLQKPEAQRAGAWQQVLAAHPKAAELPDSYRDWKTGPMALLADAGMGGDYLNYQLRQQESARAAAAERERLALSRNADARAGELHTAQMGQLKMATPEARAEAASRYGLQPGTPEYQQFVLNGTLSTRSSTLDNAVAKSQVDGAEADIKAGYGAEEVLQSSKRLRELAENPQIEAAIGSVRGNQTYQDVVGRLPLTETIGVAAPALNQQIAQVRQAIVQAAQQKLKGLGPMSDADAARVEKAVGNLERARNRTEFINAVGEIERAVDLTVQRAMAAKKQYPQLGSRLGLSGALDRPRGPDAEKAGGGWKIERAD